jgi:hypothetical protein
LVVAVQLENQLWCYVREYTLSDGFLPFFSTESLPADKLPSLKASLHFDLWCYDAEETPMVAVGIFPFESEEESYGEPCYTPPDLIEPVYTIHEIYVGLFRLRKTKDETQVSGMRLQKRYEPHEFSQLLRDKMGEWPVLGSAGSAGSPS